MSDCPFESDVLDALASHRWPAKAGDELRAHVDACESCRSLAVTAEALMSEHDTAYAEARLPSPAAVWHRAQLRARDEAARAATRPISFVQGVAFALGLALALGVASWALPLAASLAPDPSAVVAWFRSPSPSLDAGADASWLAFTPIQIAIAGWLLLAPIAAYFALARE